MEQGDWHTNERDAAKVGALNSGWATVSNASGHLTTTAVMLTVISSIIKQRNMVSLG